MSELSKFKLYYEADKTLRQIKREIKRRRQSDQRRDKLVAGDRK